MTVPVSEAVFVPWIGEPVGRRAAPVDGEVDRDATRAARLTWSLRTTPRISKPAPSSQIADPRKVARSHGRPLTSWFTNGRCTNTAPAGVRKRRVYLPERGVS